MFENLIVDQNPHWDGTLYEEGVPREVLSKVKDYLALPHIIALVGVRQREKPGLSAQLQQTCRNHRLERQNGQGLSWLFQRGLPAVQPRLLFILGPETDQEPEENLRHRYRAGDSLRLQLQRKPGPPARKPGLSRTETARRKTLLLQDGQ